ncbi:MAG TPA: zinc ribbon domain-containing protein [Myxococcota bacterium]|nr:zinc ribbon domain-containing protein [Myxococcota bacterium]
MPVYEYACEKCGHEFEASQRITDEPIKVCPKCRARRVKRLISQTSFVLKGSGWYSDLYSSKGKDKKEKSDSESSSDASPSSAPSSESKSDDASSKPKDSEKGKGKSKGKGKGKKSSKAAA